MSKMKSLHHIIPVSRGGIQERDSRNTIDLNVLTHQKLHAAFGNATPSEQLIDILNNNKNKISLTKKQSIFTLLLEAEPKDIYIPELIIDLEKLSSSEFRIGQILKRGKIEKSQNEFFEYNKMGEKRLLKTLNISNAVLRNNIREKLLKIIS